MTKKYTIPPFSSANLGHVAIIGFGLIGSSLARVIRAKNIALSLTAIDTSEQTLREAESLSLADAYHVFDQARAAFAKADFIIIATPIGTIDQVMAKIAPHLKDSAIITDVGSVKILVTDSAERHLKFPQNFVAGHPIAGTENSGPGAGFAELFQGRWCILTPIDDLTDHTAIARVETLWERAGSRVAFMDAAHHDRVLAITSHLPHLIAYTIVGTATDLEDHLQAEIIKYSASGFRDFTRIAASDPIMWRDIFLNNRGPVLEMVQRLQEDLAILQRAIRIGDGKALEEHFTRTRAIRRKIIEAKQA